MPKSFGKGVTISLQIPFAKKKQLEEHCERTGMNQSDLVRSAIEAYLLHPEFTWQDFIKWKEEVDDNFKEVSEALQEISNFVKATGEGFKAWKEWGDDVNKLLSKLITKEDLKATFIQLFLAMGQITQEEAKELRKQELFTTEKPSG